MDKDKQRDTSSPPGLKAEYSISVTSGVIFGVLVMLALPISQYISGITERHARVVETIDFQPPDVPPEPPPPEDVPDEEQIDDVEEARELPTLDQLELALNPDISGLATGDFTVPDFSLAGGIQDIIFELRDLSSPPRAVFQPEPTYPAQLRNVRTAGEVVVEFIVTSDGSTRDIRITSSSNPAFEEPTLRAIRRWRFEPGQKDGQAVNVRVRQRIPFQAS